MEDSAPPSLTARHWRLSPGAAEVGLRLDQYLAQVCGELSRGTWRKVIDLGGVHCDGRRVRHCSREVKIGEVIEAHLDGLSLLPYFLSAAAILHRDPYLLVIDKPPGVETQPTPARYRGTLYDAVLNYLQDPARPHVAPELGMVQRLDRDTSGVIVFSTHRRTHRVMTEIFTGRKVEKVYLALVHGAPKIASGEIVSHLARCRDNRVRSVPKGGKEAITRYRVLQQFAGASLLVVELLTGRMHQIRAHLAELGCPLLGDRRYGGRDSWNGRPVLRQMLHCRRMTFPHPLNGTVMTFIAPLPGDFVALLGQGVAEETLDV